MVEYHRIEDVSGAGKHLPAPLYVIKGALFLIRNRVLWKYAAAPMAIGGAVIGVSYVILLYLFSKYFTPYTANEWYLRILYYLLLTVITVLLVVLFFFFFTRLASALAAPFNDLISQKTEELVTGNFQDTPFSFIQLFKDSTRSIAHSFRVLALYLILLIASLVFLLVPGFGEFLFTLSGAVLSSYMFAYEYLGYPMDRRRYSWKEKQLFLKKTLKSIIGFGFGNLAVASIPLVNLLFIPAAVIGGTLLFLDLESAQRNSSKE